MGSDGLVYRHRSFSVYLSLLYEQVPLEKLAVLVVCPPLAQLRGTPAILILNDGARCAREGGDQRVHKLD